MKLIKPITLTSSMITATTATETVALWSSATTYSAGAQVRYGNRIYQSLLASNTNQQPDTATTYWKDIGPSNTTALIDGQVSNRTTASGSLSVTLTPGAACTGIALLGLAGSSVTISVVDSGTTIYTQTISLIREDVADWSSWFFTAPQPLEQVALFDLPPYGTAQITITVTGPSTVSIGEVVLGSARSIGEDSLQAGASIGVIDYSTKTTDATGKTTFTPGAWSKRLSGTLMLSNSELSAAQNLLASLRSQPTVFVGAADSTLDALTVYGYVREFSITIPYPTRSLCRLEIEGLI